MVRSTLITTMGQSASPELIEISANVVYDSAELKEALGRTLFNRVSSLVVHPVQGKYLGSAVLVALETIFNPESSCSSAATVPKSQSPNRRGVRASGRKEISQEHRPSYDMFKRR